MCIRDSITSKGEAAIIDPLRETQPYIDRLIKDGVKLKYIFETHFHADFVSGHLDLSQKTGASIVYGPTAKPDFECIIAEDSQGFSIGDITIKVLHLSLIHICIQVRSSYINRSALGNSTLPSFREILVEMGYALQIKDKK